MPKLTEDFVLEVFKSEGCYLSDPTDISEYKFCDETSEIIRENILNSKNHDVENVLKHYELFEQQF